MKHSNNLKVYLTLLAIIAIAVFLIMNKFLVYGIVLFGIVVLIFAIWQFFIKSRENEIAKLNSLLNNIEKKNTGLLSQCESK